MTKAVYIGNITVYCQSELLQVLSFLIRLLPEPVEPRIRSVPESPYFIRLCMFHSLHIFQVVVRCVLLIRNGGAEQDSVCLIPAIRLLSADPQNAQFKFSVSFNADPAEIVSPISSIQLEYRSFLLFLHMSAAPDDSDPNPPDHRNASLFFSLSVK